MDINDGFDSSGEADAGELGYPARGSAQEIVVNEVPVTLHGDVPLGPVAGALRAGERRLMHGAPGLFRFVKSVKGVVAGNRARP